MNYNEMLYEAASKKEWEKVRELLKILRTVEEPENLSPDYGGRNALYFALISGEFAIASRLYELGLRLDCPLQNCVESDSGKSPVSGIRVLQFLEFSLVKDLVGAELVLLTLFLLSVILQ